MPKPKGVAPPLILLKTLICSSFFFNCNSKNPFSYRSVSTSAFNCRFSQLHSFRILVRGVGGQISNSVVLIGLRTNT